MAILPLIILAFYDSQDAKSLLILTSTGHVSLLPLLFTPLESVLRCLIVLTYTLFMFKWNQSYYNISNVWKCLNLLEWTYLFGLVVVVVFDTVFPWIAILQRFTFLPLMIYSIYCSLGLIYCWLRLYCRAFTSKTVAKVKTK